MIFAVGRFYLVGSNYVACKLQFNNEILLKCNIECSCKDMLEYIISHTYKAVTNI